MEQTISIDGILVVSSNNNLGRVLDRVKDCKNVKVIVYGDCLEATYSPQIINYCEDKQSLMNFLLNIPEKEEEFESSFNDLMYSEAAYPNPPLCKGETLNLGNVVLPWANKPLVFIRLPNKLQ